MTTPREQADSDVAIVGMGGRFPGAGDVDALWRRVAAGEDCLTDLDPDDLVAAGVPAELVHDPSYVRRAGTLDDVAGFDAAFFGIGERDAAVMDPQHRHFLECAWEALESAGHVPERFPGSIGVFGGSGMNTYLINNLLTNDAVLPQLGWFLLRHTGNDKDFLTNGVAYRLDLRGPAVNVQTACSTSLVAVHLAVQSLLSFECDLALAGGVTIEVPHGLGYQHREGEILAPDGRCRAFDARSGGTVLTSGVAVVALRRLADALSDRDPVLAVIKGTAINNDGSRKVSFLAPSVDGHADVVREALTVAGLSARDLQLLEAHGTGTAVGDPVELAALTEAFRSWTTDTSFCRVTSTKPNIGHLDTAAGAASLIKVVQALRHRVLPPLANHTGPNELLDLGRSPFVLSGRPAPWPGDAPRRAGVSSLGVGGTNAHVVVEEAPAAAATPPAPSEQVLVLSARTAEALEAAAARLGDHLADTEVDLADVASTLAVGRRAMRHRLVATATDAANAVEVLRAGDRHRATRCDAGDGGPAPRLGFLFPGGGSQYPGMGAGLDARFATFHGERHRGAAIVQGLGGPDLLALMDRGADPAGLRKPTASLPAVFVTAVALARQWLAFGAQPQVLVGHSLGEYVAAHLAGVMSLEDALSLVVTRSRLMERVSGTGAAMLVVPLGEEQVLDLLPASLSLAAVNAVDECVVAGPQGEVERFAELAADHGGAGPLLPLSAAAHSSLLDPVLPEFLDAVRAVPLSPPRIPYPSNVTGTWVTAEQATDPRYWVDHLRGTVRFADCLRTVLSDGPTVLSELGPGQALSSYARRQRPGPVAAIPVLRHPDHDIADSAFTAHAFARQWAAGAEVDVDVLTGGDRRKVVLPTYPFEHQRHWIEPGAVRTGTWAGGPGAGSNGSPGAASADEPLRRIDDLDRACWLPSWAPCPPPGPACGAGRWLVLADAGDGFGLQVASELRRRSLDVVVREVDPADDDRELDLDLESVTGVVVVAPSHAPFCDDPASTVERSTRRWLDQLGAAAVAAGAAGGTARLVALTRGALAAGGPAARPGDALALGVTSVAPREYPELRCRLVDADGDAPAVEPLVDDLLADGPPVVAHRLGVRLAPTLDRVADVGTAADPVTFREGGTYVVTGGLGGVGSVLAAHLAQAYQANLVLVTSSPLPPVAERERWLAEHAYDDATSQRLRRLAEIERLGRKVAVVVADLADPASLRRALDAGEREVGPIDGAIHAAGAMHDRLLALATPADNRRVVRAKAVGALALIAALHGRGAELVLLVSSTSTALAPSGQASYVAANAVLDALAGHHGSLRVATINFGVWAGSGMASEAGRRVRLGLTPGEPVTHPVLGERVVGPDGTVAISGRLHAGHHWLVDEHRTGDGVALLPGTGHLDLMLAAASLLDEAGTDELDLVDVALLEPLVVPDGVAVTVRVTVTAGPARTVRVEGDGGSGDRWILHSEARLEPVDGPLGRELPTHAAAVHAAGDPVDPLDAPRRRLRLGPRWDAVASAACDGTTAVARLALPPPFRAEALAWRAHPALLDVATAVAVALARPDDPSALHVPVRYGRVRIDAPLPGHLTVRADRHPTSTAEMLRVDLTADDQTGRRVLDIHGLELLAVPTGARFATPPDPSGAGAATGSRSLLEVADQLGLQPDWGSALVERLLASGHDRMAASTIDLDALRARLDGETNGDRGARRAGPATGAAPSTLEDLLRAAWCELLGLDDVDDHSDFFELGGHSLIAVRLMARLRRELQVRLQLSELFDASTIAALAARIRADRPGIDAELAGGKSASTAPGADAGLGHGPDGAGPMDRHLVPISKDGDGRPLYVVHGAGGNVLFLWSLARAMPGRPLYGFQAHGIQGADMPDPSIERMAERYVAELRAHGPGPYLLGGFSGGSLVALEMVNQLRSVGEEVDLVVLFDSVPSGRTSPSGWRRNLNVVRHLAHHGVGPLRPYLRQRVQARARRFLPAPADHTLEVAAQERALGYADTDAHGFVNLYWYFTAAAEAYRTGRYDVDAVVLKADDVWPTQPEDYHWRRHIAGELHVRTAPGDHHSMFYPEHATRMAAVLRPLLDRYDPR